MCKLCVYCEIIELPTGSKMYIHYNSLFTPIFIDFNCEATTTNITYVPNDGMIDGGDGIRLSRNWIELFRKNENEENIDIEYEELI
jgi:hypothetical protein